MPIENSSNSREEINKIKIVPVENIIPGINIDKLPAIKEQLEKTGDDGSSRKRLEFGSPQITSYGSEAKHGFLTDEKVRKAFEKFKDQIVVELAAGWTPYGYYLANASGAKAYAAEKPYWADKILKNLRDIPASIVPEDMLTFLNGVSEKRNDSSFIKKRRNNSLLFLSSATRT